MLFFATVLYQRLPKMMLGVWVYLATFIGLPALHWWLSGVESVWLLIAEWATYSLTLFVVGFSVELFRRIILLAQSANLLLVIAGGLANVMLFVVPGVLICISLYQVLINQGVFAGSVLVQLPYVLALILAAWHEWQAFSRT